MSNTFRRFSVAFGLGKNAKATPASSTEALADFLSVTKRNYLKAIDAEPSEGSEWTVVMGNEASGKIFMFRK